MFLMQHVFQAMINLHSRAQGVLKRVKANRLDHKFLKIHGVIRVFSAVENIQHGRGQGVCPFATKIFVKRLMRVSSGRLGVGKTDGQHGVGSKGGLVGRSVKINHEPIDGGLIKRVEAFEGGRDFCIDMIHSFCNALAAVVFFVAIAKFNRFIFSRTCARGNRRAAHGSICESDLALHRGESPRIKNLTGVNMLNG